MPGPVHQRFDRRPRGSAQQHGNHGHVGRVECPIRIGGTFSFANIVAVVSRSHDTVDLAVYLTVSVFMFSPQSLSKKTHSETSYRQPAMESFSYDALFFITYAQVSTSKRRPIVTPPSVLLLSCVLCSIASVQSQLPSFFFLEIRETRNVHSHVFCVTINKSLFYLKLCVIT